MMASSSSRNAIAVLPKEVVDQIAAGEVVQRPVSVVKEMLENSLDAESSHIIIHVEKGGLGKLTISDDGCGIPKASLALAATRHATSKLSTVDDFAHLQTFGFRGEALASISTVSRLTVTSRTEDSPVGYSQTYRNGSPTLTQPKPCARKKGTTMVVQDLFYNVPHRLKTYSKRESDEYNKILTVIQYYAIYYPYAGFVCQRTRPGNNKLVDVNTSQLQHVKALIQKRRNHPDKTVPHDDPDYIQATKQIMAHVFDSNLEKHTLWFQSSIEPSDSAKDAFEYNAEFYYTSPVHDTKTPKLVLFLNDRLVDLPPLKRALEDTYETYFPKVKPIMVVKIRVPGTQVDVNVHPSKRQVALMYQEELCLAISTKLGEELQQYGQTFQVESVAPTVVNPYNKKRKQSTISLDDNLQKQTSSSSSSSKLKDHNTGKKKVPPSKLIRTSGATPVGAIEPFLVSTQSSQKRSQSQSSSQESTGNTLDLAQSSQETTTSNNSTATDPSKDSESFIVADNNSNIQASKSTPIDFSEPGAFASALKEDSRKGVKIRHLVIRPNRVKPTKCDYISIGSLRKRINNQTSRELCREFRDAYFVGVMSHQRSLIQCGENLMMMNHLELAKILFYQLALARFGGAVMAQLGDKGSDNIRIKTIIAQALQVEDDLVVPEDSGDPQVVEKRLEQHTGFLPVKDVHESFAKDAATCLLNHADMLNEYFSIQIEKDEKGGNAIITGLPVLLDGHTPEPHGLPIFLLRLATEVNWSEERTCFHGICRELGNYYAMLPVENHEAYIRYTLFPALSFLLLPPERIRDEGHFTTMTKLSTLYKVFERC